MSENDDYDIQDEYYNDEEDEVESDASDNEDIKEEEEKDDISPAELIEAAASAQSALAARNKMREAMQADIEAFLARGGTIQQVEGD